MERGRREGENTGFLCCISYGFVDFWLKLSDWQRRGESLSSVTLSGALEGKKVINKLIGDYRLTNITSKVLTISRDPWLIYSDVVNDCVQNRTLKLRECPKPPIAMQD